ncbi:MAG: hypothetical protein JWR32_3031 [Mycobacterium sp.]|jgi:hypothetical protein|nr:hypothetical protein [Mycobacterium sp.]
MNTTLFGQFQYPTVPLGVSDEYRNRLLQRALGRHPELCEGQ